MRRRHIPNMLTIANVNHVHRTRSAISHQKQVGRRRDIRENHSARRVAERKLQRRVASKRAVFHKTAGNISNHIHAQMILADICQAGARDNKHAQLQRNRQAPVHKAADRLCQVSRNFRHEHVVILPIQKRNKMSKRGKVHAQVLTRTQMCPTQPFGVEWI